MMSKTRIICLLLLVTFCIVGVCGCVDNTPPASVNKGQTQAVEAKVTEDNQARLITSCPAPQLQNSLERENLKRRLEFLNKPDALIYVYLVSNDGKILEQLVTHKVSSVNSLLTTPDQIVPDPFTRYYHDSGDHYGMVVASPDLDGSYGSNGPESYFAFDMNGQYHEWSCQYVESSSPFTLTTPILMVQTNGK